MAIVPIRQLGDPVLRQPARPVDSFDRALRKLAEDMIETMYDAPGVGLAGPQIGRSIRFFVFDDQSGAGARALANPELSGMEGRDVSEEGCLSIRGPYAPTPRATRLEVRGYSLEGEPVSFAAEGLLARIMQHETDHLDGMLYIDRISEDDRREVMRQLREQELGGPARRGSGAR
jgi:peptide deformylase